MTTNQGQNPNQFYNNGCTLKNKRDYDRAIQYFEMSINKKEPFGPLAYAGLGYCYFQKGDTDSALNYYLREEIIKYGSRLKDFASNLVCLVEFIDKIERYDEFLTIEKRLTEINSSGKNLCDFNNRPFNDKHHLVKFIRCYVLWKVERKYDQAVDLISSIKFNKKNEIIDRIKKDKEMQEKIFKTNEDNGNNTKDDYPLRSYISESAINSPMGWKCPLQMDKPYEEYLKNIGHLIEINDSISQNPTVPKNLIDKTNDLSYYFANLSTEDFTVYDIEGDGKVNYDSPCEPKGNLFDYLHNSGYSEDQDLYFDVIPYEVKIQIIKELGRKLKKYYLGEGNKPNFHKSLNPFNILLVNDTHIDYSKDDCDEKSNFRSVSFPGIKLGYLPTETFTRQGRNLENWTYYEDYGTNTDKPHFLYSFGVIIWEILSRKIPYPKVNSLPPELIQSYLKNEILSSLPLSNTIPNVVFEFLFKLINRKNSINYSDKEEIIRFFDEVERLPNRGSDFAPVEQASAKIGSFAGNDLTNKRAKMDNTYNSKFNNTSFFNTQEMFIESIEKVCRCKIESPNLVTYIGCGGDSYFSTSWFFYTEKLGQKLSEIFQGKDYSLINDYRIKFLKDLCDIVMILDGRYGIYINALLPNYLYLVRGEDNKQTIKILNYGVDFEILEKLFPRKPSDKRSIVNGEKTGTDKEHLKEELVEDFVELGLCFFAPEIRKASHNSSMNNQNLINHFQQASTNASPSDKGKYNLIATFIQYMDRQIGLSFPRIKKILSAFH